MREIHKREKLFIWRDAPVDVEAAVYQEVSEHWGNDVVLINRAPASPERAALGWNTGSLAQIDLSLYGDPDEAAHEILSGNRNAIHIFYGFRGGVKLYLDDACATAGMKVALIAERPSYFGPGLKGIAGGIAIRSIYRRAAKKYGPKIGAFLAMGERGVKEYARLGFPSEKLFPFMYAPYFVNHSDDLPSSSDRVRFLYIGRISRKFKGVDILLEAVNDISQVHSRGTWSLDLVGGYGDMLDEVRSFAKRTPGVEYLGSWSPNEVVQKMRSYDIAVVPSKYDGWNVVPNHAINSHIGVIVSDQATSDDLVRSSGAGIVVSAGDADELARAMTRVLRNPDLIGEFSASAARHETNVRPDTVGAYLIRVLDYAFGTSDVDRPDAPWMRVA